MPTNVPTITLTPTGWVAPTQADILTGVQDDINTAFGGNLNFGTQQPGQAATPQSQIATSLTAIIGNANDLLLALFNGVDPAFASGRLQDAIARIYFLTRNPPLATVIQVACSGAVGVVIPVGALVQDPSTNDVYVCTNAGTIPVGGSITLPFANQIDGPVAVPVTVSIYQAIVGWDAAVVSSGAVGNAVEGRAAFEARRAASVAVNAKAALPSIRGAVLSVADVLSAYTAENFNTYPIAFNEVASSLATAISGTALTISGTITGTIANGQVVTGPGVTANTTIVSGSGSSWVITPSQTVASASLKYGGVVVNAKTIYVSVAGGVAQDVADAIWSKKPPGVGYTGNTTETVYDTSPPYVLPGIPYSVTFQTATDVGINFNISIANSVAVPADAAAQIQGAILAAFSGADGGVSAEIGSTILNARFYPGLIALGQWAQVLSVTMGKSNATAACVITTASIALAVLTVTTISSGSMAVGDVITGTGVAPGTFILNQLTGSAGSTGTYTVSISQTVGAEAMNAYAVASTSIQMRIDEMPTAAAASINVVLV